MRKRQPGFYISVRPHYAQPGMSLPSELLDGPWPTLDAARHRAGEVRALRGGEANDCSIVRVADDGFTVLRDVDET